MLDENEDGRNGQDSKDGQLGGCERSHCWGMGGSWILEIAGYLTLKLMVILEDSLLAIRPVYIYLCRSDEIDTRANSHRWRHGGTLHRV